ncbi:MAG: hypothetical protein OEW27_05555 [Aquincola sp.]|nr:hypothetical protein [Aquincola sp.]MDH5329395.1 hypothetical protein [Aquincola sp.]
MTEQPRVKTVGAIEVRDGVLAHSRLGAFEPGDIPAEVRACARSAR